MSHSSVREQFPDLSQSLIYDVFQLHRDNAAEAVRVLSDLATDHELQQQQVLFAEVEHRRAQEQHERNAHEQQQQRLEQQRLEQQRQQQLESQRAARILAHLQRVRARSLNVCTSELAVYQRQSQSQSQSQSQPQPQPQQFGVPNGRWVWTSSVISESTATSLTTLFPNNTLNNNTNVNDTSPSLAFTTVRIHNGTFNVIRRNIAPHAPVRLEPSSVIACDDLALVFDHDRAAPLIVDPTTIESLGELTLPESIVNDTSSSYVYTSSPSQTGDTLFFTKLRSDSDGTRTMHVVKQSLHSSIGKASSSIPVIEWKPREEDWEEIGARDDPVVVPTGASIHQLVTMHWLIICVSADDGSDQSVAWCISRIDLVKAANSSAANALVAARRLDLPFGGVLHFSGDYWDGESGSELRLFVVSNKYHSLRASVCSNDVRRSNNNETQSSVESITASISSSPSPSPSPSTISRSTSWPATDQSPADSGPQLHILKCCPLVPSLNAVIEDSYSTSIIRGTISGWPVMKDGRVERIYWLSHGTWPELDTVRLAQSRHLPAESRAPSRQNAALYATDRDGRIVDSWFASEPMWLSAFTVVQKPVAGGTHERYILVSNSRVTIEDANEQVTEELVVFDGTQLAQGPLYVVRGATNEPVFELGFDCPSGVWIPSL